MVSTAITNKVPINASNQIIIRFRLVETPVFIHGEEQAFLSLVDRVGFCPDLDAYPLTGSRFEGTGQGQALSLRIIQHNFQSVDSTAIQQPGCVIMTRGRKKHCIGITPNVDMNLLTIHNLAGILVDTDNKISVLPALSEKSMQATTNSDPKVVRVRNGNVSSERIRERLTEESNSVVYFCDL
jgi:hypothetical protein